jgi:hypothetical protein
MPPNYVAKHLVEKLISDIYVEEGECQMNDELHKLMIDYGSACWRIGDD